MTQGNPTLQVSLTSDGRSIEISSKSILNSLRHRPVTSNECCQFPTENWHWKSCVFAFKQQLQPFSIFLIPSCTEVMLPCHLGVSVRVQSSIKQAVIKKSRCPSTPLKRERQGQQNQFLVVG